MKTILTLAFSLVVYSASTCQSLITTAYVRSFFSLNGKWNYIVDPYENGYYNYRYEPYDQSSNPSNNAYFENYKPKDKSELVEYDFDKSDNLLVPGDWNSQKEKLFYYEGTVWYKKSFDYQLRHAGDRAFVYFGAVNYQCDVYLNGKKLGTHRGGFTPFNFEVTNIIKPKNNFLIVKVDNKRKREEVPTLNTDWWNYGGITRDVKIIETPASFIEDFVLQLNPKQQAQLTGFVRLNSSTTGQRVSIAIPEMHIQQQVAVTDSGYASLSIPVKDIHRWSPGHPYLYKVFISTGIDTVVEQIGFRTIETKGADILLNGQPVFLRGISIHEENARRGGRAFSMEDARLLLTSAKELGCNYVRLAHYPHNENMERLADEMGIMIWEENPVYWTILWKNESTYQNAEHQLRDMIKRDRNRASVIIWSMANETPVSEERLQFLDKLAATARSLDNTRLISAALEQHSTAGNENMHTITDPFASSVDVLSFNEYIGWYDGLPSKITKAQWQITQNKPVLISEFGADALQGLHGDTLTRWSEEYQEDLYKKTIAMLRIIPQLRGMTPWILYDFRSPRRVLSGIEDGWNRKGLIGEAGDKKKAYFVLQSFYREMEEKYSQK